MGDEIRITVIATGFDNGSMAAKTNVTQIGGMRRSNLTVPTFIRNEKQPDAGGTMGTLAPEEEGNPDLEIPTFLRRQAD